MSAVIRGIKDTLDERVREFEQTPLRHPVFINSVPKSGTHLLRNILRMFVPSEQHYHHEFVQLPNLQTHGRAFAAPYLSCGHLLFADASVVALGDETRHIMLIRDPYDWVLARARFHLSDEFQQENLSHLKRGVIPAPELLNMMILGIHQKAPSMRDMYLHNAVGWFGTNAVFLRYEDLVEAANDLNAKRSEALFMKLFADCGIDHVPEDWRERVEIGADRRQSRTARENLKVIPGVELPDRLPDAQRRLIDFAAPGLRSFFGYD